MVNIDKYTAGLNKTLCGKNDNFFLINDYNDEIKQHYDSNYESNLDYDSFKENQRFKREYFKFLDINYGFFVVADKSVVLRDYVPFKANSLKRHMDILKNHIYDTAFCLNDDDFLRNDTNITSTASLKLVSYFLSTLHSVSIDNYERIFSDNTHFEVETHQGNLFKDSTWSDKYDKELYVKYAYLDVDVIKSNEEYQVIENNQILEQFRSTPLNNSQYYINQNSISDKKVLIFCDSSIDSMIELFCTYYRQVFCYYSNNHINKKLVEWYMPDDVLEVYVESSLDKFSSNQNEYPVSLNINQCELSKDVLHIDLNVTNGQNNIPFACEVYLNDKLIYNESVKDTVDFKYKLTTKDYGYSQVTIQIKNDYNVDYEFYEEFNKELFLPITDVSKYLSSLKGTMKGKGNNFFLVNDASREMKQHYDPDYKSRFNPNNFRKLSENKYNYLDKKNIRYDFFSIVDKSVVLFDQLPFNNETPNRVVNTAEGIHDISTLLNSNDYRYNDSRLTDKASLKIISYILSVITDKTAPYYKEALSEYVTFEQGISDGNLFIDSLWSYDKGLIYEENKDRIIQHMLVDEFYEEVDLNNIPKEFRKFNGNKPSYYKNESSLTDKKLLIFSDSSIVKALPLFTFYYTEVLVYNSHGHFLKEVIDWFNPDNLIEMYKESLVEGLMVLMDEDGSVHHPIKVSLDECSVSDSKLNIKVKGKDLYGNNLDTTSNIKLDNDLVAEDVPFIDGVCEFTCDVENKGCFFVDVAINQSKTTKAVHLQSTAYEPVVDFTDYMKTVKASMLAKEGYLFLTNDEYNEIKQHYDNSFEYTFNYNAFKEKQNYKKDFLQYKSIPYHLFIVPDKSVVLQDYLPFEASDCFRISDELDEYVEDLSDIINESDYIISDTHVCPKSALKVASYMISKYSNKSNEELEEIIGKKLNIVKKPFKGDLLDNNNWYYPYNSFYKRNSSVAMEFFEVADSYEEVSQEQLPSELKNESMSDSLHYINKNSLTDKKALILCDSNINFMIPVFIAYYKEVFFYYDQWCFNEDLINWFNPDDVVDMKTEKLMVSPDITFIKNKENYGNIPPK